MELNFTGYQAQLLLEIGVVESDRVEELAIAVDQVVQANNAAVFYLNRPLDTLPNSLPLGDRKVAADYYNYLKHVIISMACGIGVYFSHGCWSFQLLYHSQTCQVEVCCFIDVGHGQIAQYPPVQFAARDVGAALRAIRDRLFSETPGKLIDPDVKEDV